MNPVVITLIGRSGCHLCDDARVVIDRIVTEVNAQADFSAQSSRLIVEEKSIDDDQDLFVQYWEQIPVVLIDGKMHNFWRVDENRFRLALINRLEESS